MASCSNILCVLAFVLCYNLASSRRHKAKLPTTAVSYEKFNQCDQIDDCSCSFSDGSGAINLRSLGSSSNIPKWTITGSDGWLYKYNPCIPFSLGTFKGLAVGQASTRGDSYDLGVQSTITFNTTSDGKPFVFYIAGDNDRRSRIILECDPHTEEHTLVFVGEIKYNPSLYEFILTSPCACPGYCDDTGLLNSIVIKDPQEEIDTNKAINRVELQLHIIENKMKAMKLYESRTSKDIHRISNMVNRLNRHLRNNTPTEEVGNMVKQLEGYIMNISITGKEDTGSNNLLQSSIPPLVALLAHDVFLVIIILLLIPLLISKGKVMLQKILHPRKKKTIYKTCNCKETDLLQNA